MRRPGPGPEPGENFT